MHVRVVALATLVSVAGACSPAASSSNGSGATAGDGGASPAGSSSSPSPSSSPTGGPPPAAKSSCAPADVIFGTPKTTVFTDASAYFKDLSVADLNRDGKADLVVLLSTGIEVFLSNGDGTFAKGVHSSSGGATTNAALVAADFHGTGAADVVASLFPPNTGIGSLAYLANKGDGTLSDATFIDAPSHDFLKAVAADVNGDGKLDFLFDAIANQGSSGIALNNGDGTLGAPRSVPFTNGDSVHWTAADLDGDHAAEIIESPPDGTVQGLCLRKNDGRGQIATTPVCHAGPPAGAIDRVAAGDVDGDGKIDAVGVYGTLIPDNPNIAVYLGKGDGTVADGKLSMIKKQLVGVSLADVDNDGKADLLSFADDGDASSLLEIMLSKGDGTFADPIEMAAGRLQSGVEQNPGVGDFAGNGLRGIVVHNAAKNGFDVVMASCKK